MPVLENILIVEDDKSLQKLLSDLLLDNGFSTKLASTGSKALRLLEETLPDLVLLDLGLPDISGESVCEQIKKDYPDLPVLILTAQNSVEKVIQGLGLGADDYVTKPFNSAVLIARIKATIRARKGLQEEMVKVKDLTVDLRTHEILRDTKEIELTPQEFKLLHYLISNKNRVLTREMILSRVWMYSDEIETRVVDVYIGYLRKKIDSGFKDKIIESVRGFGYIVKD